MQHLPQVWFHYDKDKSGYLEYVEFSQFMKDLFLKSDCTEITPEQVALGDTSDCIGYNYLILLPNVPLFRIFAHNHRISLFSNG